MRRKNYIVCHFYGIKNWWPAKKWRFFKSRHVPVHVSVGHAHEQQRTLINPEYNPWYTPYLQHFRNFTRTILGIRSLICFQTRCSRVSWDNPKTMKKFHRCISLIGKHLRSLKSDTKNLTLWQCTRCLIGSDQIMPFPLPGYDLLRSFLLFSQRGCWIFLVIVKQFFVSLFCSGLETVKALILFKFYYEKNGPRNVPAIIETLREIVPR